MELTIGAHVPNARPLHEAETRRADLAQVFLSNPKSWKKPASRDDAGELRRAAIPLYVHAPYLVNVASPNNRVRIPSRKILADTCQAAAEVGAAAVIVHGGYVGDDEDVEAGFIRWQKALDQVEVPIQILIENTAGGGRAVARELSVLASLWDRIGGRGVGFCLDTCHAWSAGEPLEGIVERVRDAVGRLDLVHCNDSRDPAGSGRDRHEHLGRGEIPPRLLTDLVGEAKAPVVIETRGDAEWHARDIDWLRERL